MKKLVLLLSVMVLMFGMAISSDAMTKKGMGHGKKGMGHGMEMGKGMCDEHMMMEKMAALGLDDKQKEEVKAVHSRLKKEMIRKKADVEVAKIELRELLSKDTVDLQAAEAKVKQIESLQSDMKMMHIKTHEEVKAKLTPEQRKKFSAMHDGMGCMDCGMDGGMGMKGGKGMKGMKGKCDKCAKMQDMDEDTSAADAKAGHQHH